MFSLMKNKLYLRILLSISYSFFVHMAFTIPFSNLIISAIIFISEWLVAFRWTWKLFCYLLNWFYIFVLQKLTLKLIFFSKTMFCYTALRMTHIIEVINVLNYVINWLHKTRRSSELNLLIFFCVYPDKTFVFLFVPNYWILFVRIQLLNRYNGFDETLSVLRILCFSGGFVVKIQIEKKYIRKP